MLGVGRYAIALRILQPSALPAAGDIRADDAPAVRQTLANGLALLGVGAPEKM